MQDASVYQAQDPRVLEWASQESRILLTHDKRTMPGYVYARLASGKSTPGVVIVSDKISLGQAIEELLLILVASEASEWTNTVVFLPL